MPHPILLHALPTPLVAALAEQGFGAPDYQLTSACAEPASLRLVVAGSAAEVPEQLTIWRTQGLRAPVLLLGSSGEDWEVTETLALPVRLGALMARMRFYLSLAQEQSAGLVPCGSHSIDPVRKILRHGDREEIMTEKETAIMLLLAESAQPWSREDLLREIWGYDASIDTHTLETHIYRLRRKLAALNGGGDIVTTPAGYQLACP